MNKVITDDVLDQYGLEIKNYVDENSGGGGGDSLYAHQIMGVQYVDIVGTERKLLLILTLYTPDENKYSYSDFYNYLFNHLPNYTLDSVMGKYSNTEYGMILNDDTAIENLVFNGMTEDEATEWWSDNKNKYLTTMCSLIGSIFAWQFFVPACRYLVKGYIRSYTFGDEESYYMDNTNSDVLNTSDIFIYKAENFIEQDRPPFETKLYVGMLNGKFANVSSLMSPSYSYEITANADYALELPKPEDFKGFFFDTVSEV